METKGNEAIESNKRKLDISWRSNFHGARSKHKNISGKKGAARTFVVVGGNKGGVVVLAAIQVNVHQVHPHVCEPGSKR